MKGKPIWLLGGMPCQCISNFENNRTNGGQVRGGVYCPLQEEDKVCTGGKSRLTGAIFDKGIM